VFFLEKKNQKTFARLVPRQGEQDASGDDSVRAKVFWFFFSKKNPAFFLPW
jgi:hypothetical protein